MWKFGYKLTLALIIVTSIVFTSVGESSADTPEELIIQKQQVDEEILKLNEEIEKLKTALQQQIEKYEATKKEIVQVNQKIQFAEESIDIRRKIIEGRLKAYQIEKSNFTLYMEVILSASSITDILEKVTSVNTILDADQTLIDEQYTKQKKLEENKLELTKLQKEQQQRFENMQQQQADIELLIAENEASSLRLQDDIEEAELFLAEQRAFNLRSLRESVLMNIVDNPPAQLENIMDGVEKAKTYLGMPYVWGGMDPLTSFDCSGLIIWSYGQVGIELPRVSADQFLASVHIQTEDALPGDLVFFSYGKGIAHVGIYLGEGLMLNSQNAGVVIESVGDWAEHFVGFGRVVN